MKKLLLLCICVATFAAKSQTTISGSFMHDGVNRSYIMYVPAAYSSSTPVPLVFNLHGYGSNNTQQNFYGNFKGIADTANFLILLPQGLNDGGGTSHWNAEWGTGVDDLGFLNALIDTISNNYSVNQNRIYSTGMSNGGFMSLTLAGELSHRIAAVASVTGTMSVLQIPLNTLTRPMPIMQIHSTIDPTVPFTGNANFLSVDSVLNYWAAHNNCNMTPTITPVPDINTADGCTAELYEFTGGDLGSEVIHYRITGGGHTWPGAAFNTGVTNQDFDASIEIWKFFSKYELSTFLSVEQDVNESNDWYTILGGNPTNGNLLINVQNNNKFEISLYDINGKKVLDRKNQIGTSQIDMTNSINGIYILNITNGTNHSTLKIVKTSK